jgi:hypothetical protein
MVFQLMSIASTADIRISCSTTKNRAQAENVRIFKPALTQLPEHHIKWTEQPLIVLLNVNVYATMDMRSIFDGDTIRT